MLLRCFQYQGTNICRMQITVSSNQYMTVHSNMRYVSCYSGCRAVDSFLCVTLILLDLFLDFNLRVWTAIWSEICDYLFSHHTQWPASPVQLHAPTCRSSGLPNLLWSLASKLISRSIEIRDFMLKLSRDADISSEFARSRGAVLEKSL